MNKWNVDFIFRRYRQRKESRKESREKRKRTVKIETNW